MRLSQFIIAEKERILEEFEAFARTLVPAGTMGVTALRDHASAMLNVIARDLETPQTTHEGSQKAKGQSDSSDHTADTPAQEHGSGRATSGFTFVEMVSEYRALRASVIQLWIEATGNLEADDVKDLVRFNEAIDQALAESTTRFTEDLDRTRETFLAILGHDLRSPLSAIVTSAQFMLDETELPAAAQKLTATIMNSGRRMNEMVSDLLDFTRGRLGVGMPVSREPMDLGVALKTAVDEIKAAQPDRLVLLQTNGNLSGEWDRARLQQVMSNLLGNALDHGAGGSVTVTATGDANEVVLTVHNDGPPIAPDKIGGIFDPLTRGPSESEDTEHLGLGLYIVEQIVTGHGGNILVDSTADRGTTFTLRLPKHATTSNASGR
jgi:signal transduction histidine kinase